VPVWCNVCYDFFRIPIALLTNRNQNSKSRFKPDRLLETSVDEVKCMVFGWNVLLQTDRQRSKIIHRPVKCGSRSTHYHDIYHIQNLMPMAADSDNDSDISWRSDTLSGMDRMIDHLVSIFHQLSVPNVTWKKQDNSIVNCLHRWYFPNARLFAFSATDLASVVM